jgi:hypothetical protein
MKERLKMTNNIDLYINSLPIFSEQTPSEQERCMRVNRFRVEAMGLEPVALPDWEVCDE